MRILTFSTSDSGGGAEGVARKVAEAMRSAGHEVLWAVGRKRSYDPWVVDLQDEMFPGAGRRLTRFLMRNEGRVKGAGLALRTWIGWNRPRNLRRWRQGKDPSDFPEVERVFNRFKPDVVHCHNLHGSGLAGRPYMGYFDLRCLKEWSRSVPVCLTLHDAWMLTGHCAHPLDCRRWLDGCGLCPYLANPPAYPRDATAENWADKKAVYAQSKLSVSAPSNWLLDMVGRSILSPALGDVRCIPNGIDTALFRPLDKAAARDSLDLPHASDVLLFLSNGVANPYKGFDSAYDVFQRVRKARPERRLTLLVGGVRPGESLPDDPDVRAVPKSSDPARIVNLYCAASAYIHPAIADTHPLTVLEAMACGTPVAAYAVGGIPEQIDDGRTGILVPPGEASMLSNALVDLLGSPERAAMLGSAARCYAVSRFDQAHMIAEYTSWLHEVAHGAKADR